MKYRPGLFKPAGSIRRYLALSVLPGVDPCQDARWCYRTCFKVGVNRLEALEWSLYLAGIWNGIAAAAIIVLQAVTLGSQQARFAGEFQYRLQW